MYPFLSKAQKCQAIKNKYIYWFNIDICTIIKIDKETDW